MAGPRWTSRGKAAAGGARVAAMKRAVNRRGMWDKYGSFLRGTTQRALPMMAPRYDPS